jgi:hypothetical protein
MLRRCIAHWRKDRLGDINNQEEVCKTALKWLEKQEENRHITSLEKIMKKILRERFEEISIIKETIWSQRAKRQWIREGDKNTSFFHMVATIQKRQNTVYMLRDQYEEHTSHGEKATILFQYFVNLIGLEDNSERQFDFQHIYDEHMRMEGLTKIIREQEIKEAITHWPNKKAPGPDSFTGEFYKKFMELLLPGLLEVYNMVLRHPQLTLHPLNDSYIILIPKKEDVFVPRD